MKWKDLWLGNLNGSQLGYVFRVSVEIFVMDSRSMMLEEVWLETVRVIYSGHQVGGWLGGH